MKIKNITLSSRVLKRSLPRATVNIISIDAAGTPGQGTWDWYFYFHVRNRNNTLLKSRHLNIFFFFFHPQNVNAVTFILLNSYLRSRQRERGREPGREGERERNMERERDAITVLLITDGHKEILQFAE